MEINYFTESKNINENIKILRSKELDYQFKKDLLLKNPKYSFEDLDKKIKELDSQTKLLLETNLKWFNDNKKFQIKFRNIIVNNELSEYNENEINRLKRVQEEKERNIKSLKNDLNN